MAMSTSSISDKRMNGCAVNLMRSMLVKYAQKHGISFDESMLRFAESSTYEALFDFDTAIWKEGPDYLLGIYEEELAGSHDSIA